MLYIDIDRYIIPSLHSLQIMKYPNKMKVTAYKTRFMILKTGP